MQHFAEKDRVEGLLAIGATRTEAMKGIIQRSLQAALQPSLNHMSVIGLVSLPEFLSGQLIAGSTPLQVDFCICVIAIRFIHLKNVHCSSVPLSVYNQHCLSPMLRLVWHDRASEYCNSSYIFSKASTFVADCKVNASLVCHWHILKLLGPTWPRHVPSPGTSVCQALQRAKTCILS